ncbi:MAG: hypothetical protein KF847_15345 [Pirellulales bacterium]|nr:hypothetical protein [Pirellulales bacterium]
MGTTFKAAVMLAAVGGGVAAWDKYGPLPPEARRYVDQAIGAAKGFLADHLPKSSSQRDVAGPRIDAGEPFAAPVDSTSPPLFGAEPAQVAIAPPAPTAGTGDLQPLLDQLVKLGIGEYELARWGSRGDLYRFRCAAPLAGSMDQARQFEAIAPTPLASVEQVLGEVSSWRLARSGGQFTR